MLWPMRNANVSLVRSAIVALGLSLFACGGGDSKELGKYAEACTENADCEQGLMCINKVCSLQCMSTTQCQARDPKAQCVSLVCANPCTDTPRAT